MRPYFPAETSQLIFGSLTQAQDGAQAIDDLRYTEAAQKARKARRAGSRRPLGKGGVLLASEARNRVVKKQGDELARAKAIVDKAEQAKRKAKTKAFLTAVATTRRDMVKMRTAQKKLKKELGM